MQDNIQFLPLPVRSNYLWEALRGEVPGLLTFTQVNAVATFYYKQAQVYKKNPPTEADVDELIKCGQVALEALGAR